MPLTAPAVLTLAILKLLLLQVPAPTLPVTLNVVTEPGHTEYVPLIVPASGEGATVTTEYVDKLPQLFVTE